MKSRISGQAIFRLSSWSATILRPSDIGRICLILDHDTLRTGADEAMKQALSAGIRFFQYRRKHGARRDIYERSRILAAIAGKANACFIVNDHADIAAAVDADGVHLGQDDLPIDMARTLLGRNRLIGISTHSIEEALAAEKAGADYIGFGPIFPTTTKDTGAVQGTGMLRLVRKNISVPIVAIGGIGHDNAAEVLEAGADSVAVISAILTAQSIAESAERMMKSVQEYRRRT